MRRWLALALVLLPALAWARVNLTSSQPVPDTSAPFYADGHISGGQSWRSNPFPSFGDFKFNPQAQTLLAPFYQNPLLPTTLFGPLGTGGGISLPGNITGIIGYQSTDVFSIGRTAILAQQLLRLRAGIPIAPVVEMTMAYPSSTWNSGPGGGLAPGAHITASVTTDTMTVTAITAGEMLAINQFIPDAVGLDPKTAVASFVSGTGGTGTYIIGITQFTGAGTYSTAHATFAGSIGNVNVLGVTQVLSGTVTVGDTLTTTDATSVHVLPNTTIISQRDGAAGGVGNYIVRVGAAQTAGSQALFARGVSWSNQTTVLTQLPAALPKGKVVNVRWSSLGYTQGGGQPLGTNAEKVGNLTQMLQDYDALNLPGAGTTGMRYYLGLPSAISNTNVFDDSIQGTYTFARTNAPGAGGTWSGRVFATSPSYAWPFANLALPPNFTTPVFDAPRDNIHTGNYGTARWGENEGYVRHLTQDKGIAWTPLWRPLTGGAITVSGQVVIIPMARPTSPDFATAPMVFQTDPLDGIQLWPQQGFRLHDNGSNCAATAAISGMNITLTATGCTIASGDTLEVSYAWYGPGGPSPGQSTGVGGNLTMNGPPSVLFPGKTIDAWAWPFLETITAP